MVICFSNLPFHVNTGDVTTSIIRDLRTEVNTGEVTTSIIGDLRTEVVKDKS